MPFMYVSVKGTVVTKEFHSVNGGPPEGHITVTAYSSDPTDLTNVIDRVESRGTKVSSDVKRSLHEKQNSRSKGVSSITTTTRYGGSTGNQVSRIHKVYKHIVCSRYICILCTCNKESNIDSCFEISVESTESY